MNVSVMQIDTNTAHFALKPAVVAWKHAQQRCEQWALAASATELVRYRAPWLNLPFLCHSKRKVGQEKDWW
jgi:hypothetical protein